MLDAVIQEKLDTAATMYDEERYKESYDLYLSCAEEGNAIAQTMVGWLYETGCGCKQDQDEAKKWYRMAGQNNYEDGWYMLAKLMDDLGDSAQASTAYQNAALLGNIRAAYRLGAYGLKYQSDHEYWLKYAADNNHVFAMVLLGRRMIAGVYKGGIAKGLALVANAFWQGVMVIIRSKGAEYKNDSRFQR